MNSLPSNQRPESILLLSLDELTKILEKIVQDAIQSQSMTDPGKQAQSKDDLLNVHQAENLLDVTRQTLRIWERQGRLPAVRIGRRVYFRRSDIDKALQQGGNYMRPEKRNARRCNVEHH